MNTQEFIKLEKSNPKLIKDFAIMDIELIDGELFISSMWEINEYTESVIMQIITK